MAASQEVSIDDATEPVVLELESLLNWKKSKEQDCQLFSIEKVFLVSSWLASVRVWFTKLLHWC